MKNNNKRRSTESSSSSSSSSSMANLNNSYHVSLTPDVIKDILLKLPIKSLKRFECVSKSWYSLITSHHFIYAHLRRPSRPSSLLIHRFHNLTASNFSIIQMDIRTTGSRDVRIPFLDSLVRFPKIVGSCDGLLCLDISPCYGFGFVLWNISIKQFRFLPRPGINDAVKRIWAVSTGFGYNPEINDYKLVRIVNFHCDQDGNGGDSYVVSAEVYSWRSGSWRILDSRMIKETIGAYVVHGGRNAVAINGSLNWLANGFGNLGSRKCIVSFDMGTEEFRKIDMPDYGSGICAKVMEFKGSLAVAFYPALNVYPGYGRSVNRIELWVYQEYGCAHGNGYKEWTKLHYMDLNASAMGTPLCVLNDSELLLKRVYGNCVSLAFLNPDNQSIKSLPICSPEFTCEFYSYVDSMVPVSNSGHGVGQMEEAEALE